MLAYGKLSKQQMAHESGGDNIGFEFSGVIVSLPLPNNTSLLCVMLLLLSKSLSLKPDRLCPVRYILAKFSVPCTRHPIRVLIKVQ